MLVVVTGHGAVGSLVLVLAVRADKNRGHHGKGTECRGDHVAHHVTVVVLAGPDEATLAAHHTCDRVINKGVEVLDAGGLESVLVLREHLLEDLTETSVVLLGDGVLGGEPDALLEVKGVLEASVGERTDGSVGVVHSLENAGTLEGVDYLLFPLAALAFEDELGDSRLLNADVNTLVNITVGVTGDGDRLFPELHGRRDGRDGDRCAEHRSVQHRTDRSVRALPHLMQVVLGHTLGVRSDGGALHGNTVLLGGVGGIDCHLIAGLVTMNEAEVIVFCLQINKWNDKFILNHFPQDPCHFITIHLYERSDHLNFFHN